MKWITLWFESIESEKSRRAQLSQLTTHTKVQCQLLETAKLYITFGSPRLHKQALDNLSHSPAMRQ
jgi:hypothetical protein